MIFVHISDSFFYSFVFKGRKLNPDCVDFIDYILQCS